MLEGVFQEGHAFFKGTFHAGGRFHGRSRGGERVSDLTLRFLPRLGSKTAQIDPSLLFFF